MHGHGSSRSERVRCDVFWEESKYGHSHSLGLGPDGGNDIESANLEKDLRDGEVTDRDGGVAAKISQAKEDVDALSNQADCCRV